MELENPVMSATLVPTASEPTKRGAADFLVIHQGEGGRAPPSSVRAKAGYPLVSASMALILWVASGSKAVSRTRNSFNMRLVSTASGSRASRMYERCVLTAARSPLTSSFVSSMVMRTAFTKTSSRSAFTSSPGLDLVRYVTVVMGQRRFFFRLALGRTQAKDSALGLPSHCWVLIDHPRVLGITKKMPNPALIVAESKFARIVLAPFFSPRRKVLKPYLADE